MPRSDRRPRKRLSPEERRTAILGAAAAAFARAPYDQVSVAGIAADAEASEALVHRYFAGKAELYTEILAAAVRNLLERQRQADIELGPQTPARRRLATSLEVYLDFIANASEGWAALRRNPHDGPPAAALLQARTRAHYVSLLRSVLNLTPNRQQDQALYGYLGFVDAACLAWVDDACPDEDRPMLIATALGALEGALSVLPDLGSLNTPG